MTALGGYTNPEGVGVTGGAAGRGRAGGRRGGALGEALGAQPLPLGLGRASSTVGDAAGVGRPGQDTRPADGPKHGTPHAYRMCTAFAPRVHCVWTPHARTPHAHRSQAEMVQHFADMYADKGVDEAIERAAEYQRAAWSMRVGHRLAVAGGDSLAAAA